MEAVAAELSRVIAPVVPHDALRCGTSTPSSGVGITTLAFWHGYTPDLGRELLRADRVGEYMGELAHLARRQVPVTVTRRLGPGMRDRLVDEHGAGEELCLALRSARGVWGVLCLMRAASGRPFDDVDARRLADVGPALVAAFRGYVTASPRRSVPPGPPPGMLVVGADSRIRTMTSQAQPWLEAMRTHLAVPGWLADCSFSCLAAAARELPRHVRLCVPSVGCGWWTTIEAQRLGDDGDVAVMIQLASGQSLMPSFCDWYGVTARERQIMQHLYSGSAPKQIARELDLSLYTVGDHLKALFRKTGTSGRDELIASLNM
ncbi:DNA-binding CsgD family transcriptional regulator [Nonomuraea thailandensis]|uniref:DNA-binding CsgD family transcriptional regulator n=1 Tax=Nonomuraea thailandensis TaxID=1188745 RepID=A0A9X2GE07_9ACTN|nr:helix-turn-helix transcriptional regulator [Nonomuraea thailandensis]MCP2357077.1 DNA-binding CsgD family transcriptional regulator [Nonomuraea thailandensis]